MKLWSNDWEAIEELMNGIKENEDTTELTEEEIYNDVYETLNMNYQFLLDDCDIQLDNDIICIGTLGLWNGIATGSNLIESGNIKDCFEIENECDTVTYYIDRHNNLKCTGSHHDGNNEYLFRELKDISDEQLDNFTDKIYRGECTAKDITRYTRSIGKHIKKVYGL